MTKRVDITPTWSEILSVLLVIYSEGNSKGANEALKELRRMANLADLWVAHQTKLEQLERHHE